MELLVLLALQVYQVLATRIDLVLVMKMALPQHIIPLYRQLETHLAMDGQLQVLCLNLQNRIPIYG